MMAKLNSGTEYSVRVSEQAISIPSEVLQTILTKLPFNQFPQMKLVCRGFNTVVDRVFEAQPELYGMVMPKIAYTPEMVEADADLNFARFLVTVGKNFPHHHVVRRFKCYDSLFTGGFLQPTAYTANSPVFAQALGSSIKVIHPDGQLITEFDEHLPGGEFYYSLRSQCILALDASTVVSGDSKGLMVIRKFRPVFDTSPVTVPPIDLDRLSMEKRSSPKKEQMSKKKPGRFHFFKSKKKMPVTDIQTRAKDLAKKLPDPDTCWPNTVSPEIKMLKYVASSSLKKNRLIEKKMPIESYVLSENESPLIKIIRVNANYFMSLHSDNTIKHWDASSRRAVQVWETGEKDQICALSYYNAKSVIYATYAQSCLTSKYSFVVKQYDGTNKKILFWHKMQSDLNQEFGDEEFFLTPNTLAFIEKYGDFNTKDARLSVIQHLPETENSETTFYQRSLPHSRCLFFLPSGDIGHFQWPYDSIEDAQLEIIEFFRLQRLRQEPTNTLMFSPTTFSY